MLKRSIKIKGYLIEGRLSCTTIFQVVIAWSKNENIQLVVLALNTETTGEWKAWFKIIEQHLVAQLTTGYNKGLQTPTFHAEHAEPWSLWRIPHNMRIEAAIYMGSPKLEAGWKRFPAVKNLPSSCTMRW